MRKTSDTIGGRIKVLRATTTLTQEELAKRLFMSRSCLANYEVDKRQPNLDVIRKLSDYFKVSPNYLLEGKDDELNINNPGIKSYEYLKYLTKDGMLDISELAPYHKISLIEYFLFLKSKN